jgi:small-conductance mechanosensitive channel
MVDSDMAILPNKIEKITMKTRALQLYRRPGRTATTWSHGLYTLLLLTLFMATPALGAETGTDAAAAGLELQSALDSAVTSHQEELADLKVRLAQLDTSKANLLGTMRAQENITASHNQLLLMSQPSLESLEQAIRGNRLIYEYLSDQLEKLQARYNSASILFLNAGDLIALARRQIDDIPAAQLPDGRKTELAAKGEHLVGILNEKKALGEAYQKHYDDLSNRMRSLIQQKKALDEKMTAEFQGRKKKLLFTASSLYRYILENGLGEAWDNFVSRISQFIGLSSDTLHWNQIERIPVGQSVVVLFWIGAIIGLRVSMRGALRRIDAKLVVPEWRYRRLFLYLLRRSLLYLGLTLLFGICDFLNWSLLDFNLANILFKIFLMLLLTRWGLDAINFWYTGISLPMFRAFVIAQIERFLRFLRVITLVSIIFSWAAGMESALTWVLRDVLTVVLLIWTVRFWQRAKQVVADAVRQGQAAPDPRKMKLLTTWSYLVSGGGVLISLIGYSTLAGHWWGAWIKSTTLLFWGHVSWQAIQEWRHDPHIERGISHDSQWPGGDHRLSWPLIQLCRGLWFFCMARGIIWSWDREGALMAWVTDLLNFTHTIGNLDLKLIGIVHALVILFFTHIIVHIGRTLLDEKVLGKKALEPGLKDSVITILSYLGWSIGLLLALASIGVNATSLAVVFGALSVGIGFGLQTIFNNFISGLILLFERPIQVGDFVEVNGIWAEVKKINVRATVVQTFDNASVIIPNSEFISQQVTNWSFKDRRMRKNLNIGVAYGSDIDLVEKTLLDVAIGFETVLKYPRPEVLFLDHGDNALIFCLRFWVQVEDSAIVPSRVRFEIDKRFRELGIEIPFPQRDIHIRSIAKEISAAAVTDLVQRGGTTEAAPLRSEPQHADPVPTAKKKGEE